ncbi:RteC domain-containing protein [Mucilaginibacter sp. SJ]|uniref:RteC domain-containing protein n=1 Tax=Mucilaginibacter sp. SJ TaxID=3029053 RepID=UPI0023A9A1BB|nr:RteC domain-containing protein [Mucilaginibacter sp. SJ]WEA01743.1 RteC domain-containing protein [Mucilaginibacter sp. SJ]
MNMKIETLPPTLRERLMALPDDLAPLERFNAAIGIIEPFGAEFKELISNEDFLDIKQKISAFKHIKPYIDAHRIEEGLRYTLVINRPIGRTETQVDYFEGQLESLAAFLRMNAFYYQYYKNGFTELDHLYFVPGGGQAAIPMPDLPELAPDTSTAMTYLFAKFIAYERIQFYILNQIELIERQGPSGTFYLEDSDNPVKWTGDIVNLIEVAYGVWLTGQVNNGNASLGQIVRWLESSLAVNMGNVQKKFGEIESRKRISITRFLDQMVQAINMRAEQDLLR